MGIIRRLLGAPQIDLKVEATCESCGRAYSRVTWIVARRWALDVLPFIPNRSERVREKAERIQNGDCGNLPVMRCPKCKYTQSWNLVAVRKSIAHWARVTALFLTTIALLIVYLSKGWDLGDAVFVAMILGLAAGALVYWGAFLAARLYDPNRNHTPATRTLTPTIVPPEDWPWLE
jgi:hypothetical protein